MSKKEQTVNEFKSYVHQLRLECDAMEEYWKQTGQWDSIKKQLGIKD